MADEIRNDLPPLWTDVTGSGPTVVLLHGLTDNHELWRYVAPVLSQQYKVAAVDLYGHGRSPIPAGELTTAIMADGVADLVERLGGGPAVVVGLSMGGGVAQVLALRRPDLVRGLVLVSTSSNFSPEARARLLGRVDTARRLGMASIADEFLSRQFTDTFAMAHPEEVDRSRQAILLMTTDNFAAATIANAARDWANQLPGIRCPVIFVGGAEDPAGSWERASVFRRYLPAMRIDILPASHLVPVEVPEQLNSILLGFLAELQP
jgi:pimeloyl-ACP methyl ester carboxylesterase